MIATLLSYFFYQFTRNVLPVTWRKKTFVNNYGDKQLHLSVVIFHIRIYA